MSLQFAPLFLLTTAFLASAAPPTFEIASVKSAVPGTPGGRIQFLPGGRFRATNVSLDFLIQFLYNVKPY